MKKIVLLCLLITNFLFSQNSEKKVWDLLLANKRTEARKVFDKELKSQLDKNVDILILDAFIDMELGKLNFDTEFIQKFVAFQNVENYMYPIYYEPFMLDRVSENGYTDYTYQKIDILAADAKFKDDLFVIYNKAIADFKRKNYDGHKENLKRLNRITAWQFCGVFENLNDSGIDTEYEPELYAKNDKLFDANSNGKIGWYVPEVKQTEGYHFFYNESEYGNGIIYAQTFIESSSEREVVLNFGTSSSVKIFVNDTEVFYNNDVQNTDLNAFKLKFKLQSGMNRILMKLSTKGSSDYFFASLTDENGKVIPDLSFHDTFKDYKTSTMDALNPVELNPNFENYFLNLVKQNPSNVLYQLLLFEAYLNNNKNDLADDVIELLHQKYPASSLIKVKLLKFYNSKGETQKSQEISKNLELSDENYYYTIYSKLSDDDWIKTGNIKELEYFAEKSKTLISRQIVTLYGIILASRNSDVDKMVSLITELLQNSNNNELYVTNFSYIYDALKKDKAKTISMLEKLTSEKDNFLAQSTLISYYKSADRKEDVNTILLSRMNKYPYYNYVMDDYIEILNSEQKYNEALLLIEKGLKNFPYSYKYMEKKGNAFNALKDIKSAEKMFRQSLTHHSGNTTLRKKLYDISKVPDEIEQVETKDVYKLIKERRNSNLKNDYGVTMLLDEYIVNIFPEGGRKSKIKIVYEVTGENGIEELKEYNLNSNYNTILKSEIVNKDGSVVPAEQGRGQLVFTNLRVGDVIFIEYESLDNSTGRFYKDFNVASSFNGIYPCVESIFGIIYPTDVIFKTAITNGEIPSTVKKIGTKNYKSWTKKNSQAIPLLENYAPNYSDLTNIVHVGTINSWGDIANWYSDLVKKNLKVDKITTSTFNELFPKGVKELSEIEIAKKIYKYIEDNITYSSLDFRQSGFVPQKPSKTITTKLGDCKDVSTLFVAMANQAGLKSNLVLVLTNDNGFNSMQLPDNNFNHCIVRLELAGKDYYIELTNKYLPFNSLPTSLYKANALNISFDKAVNEKAKLISISNENALVNIGKSKTEVTIDEKAKIYKHTAMISGTGKSYYNELFSNATSEDVRKREFEEDLNARLKTNITLNKVELIGVNETYEKDITVETNFSVSERLQSVGSLKITSIPFFDKVYTRSIISSETRNYAISYYTYENTNQYDSEIILNIAEGSKFTEIPENKNFRFKEHEYEITFQLLSPNSLKIHRKVSVPWTDISVAEYEAYKKFVEDVIEVEEQVVGFK